ncbi:adenosylcobinamide-GDP ribazoletransferase [Paenibacillus sp. P96]|uniref:Adenosylcobinamide-GDP ribazoletransferase n=1 Tax=Paenibacillus zeirhizosphaerae TaxID=2987519 RepID=A0ABT9FKQ5_9BACL|nr:adenosylcobinamide-GDP ribazoletransferase [Paenibacillus sp. P96]MDP4095313.1 adenosylcobinamide-GDP ribazoletransferase [Paenibacillus sp. P96]
MKRWLESAATAFQFLSRFPVKSGGDFSPELLQRSTVYYPLVGLAIAAVVWAAAYLSAFLLPPFPAAVLILMLWVWLTGGLHLDGWMDSADALLSYRSRERMLEIMKDSRVGAMGVIACVLLLLLKLSLIYTVMDEGLWSTVLLLPLIWSRWFMVAALGGWPKARQGEGLAGHFETLRGREVRLAALLATGMTVLLALLNWTGLWHPFMAAFPTLPVLAWLAGKWTAERISRRLGGLTGDVYGALNELLEALLLLAAVLLHRLLL